MRSHVGNVARLERPESSQGLLTTAVPGSHDTHPEDSSSRSYVDLPVRLSGGLEFATIAATALTWQVRQRVTIGAQDRDA
jgi:hypothetical protein